MEKRYVYNSYWSVVRRQFCHHPLGVVSLVILIVFCLGAIYAPLLASSKPLFVEYRGSWYFPLFRYLFYSGFYTKRLDIFFNIMMLTVPLFFLNFWLSKRLKNILYILLIVLQLVLFFIFAFTTPTNPDSNSQLNLKRENNIQKNVLHKDLQSMEKWNDDLLYLTNYGKLNLILRYEQRKLQNQRIIADLKIPITKEELSTLPTLWQMDQNQEEQQIAYLEDYLKKNRTDLHQKDQKATQTYEEASVKLLYLQDKASWLEAESRQLHFMVMPLFSLFHWEDQAGGNQKLNEEINWWNVTRSNRKDLLAALIFGIRISLVVGIAATAISLLIGIPVGALAGFYGGNTDIVICRLIEIWEAMPTFFMLLLVVAITQSKSVFLVIAIIGFFGWTGFCRFLRGEFFKQRNLPYVEACHAIGFPNLRIMFIHILPNAIPPLLTLVPFAVMGAVASEAGLSFLGLGEEGSCSWGVLMNEGRNVFPAESDLLWPPAILLTILLISIALIGDALRDSLDPKMHISELSTGTAL